MQSSRFKIGIQSCTKLDTQFSVENKSESLVLVWRTSQKVYSLYRWERHLSGFLHLIVVNQWLITLVKRFEAYIVCTVILRYIKSQFN